VTDPISRRTYLPGSWFGIFGGSTTVLLPPSEKGRVAALWALIDDGAGFDEVLDALISTGLRDLPGFVLVSELDGGTQVVIRGAAHAEFDTAQGVVEIAGSSATTWVEHTLSGVTRISLVVEETNTEEEALTIGPGLVRLARVDAPPPVGDIGVTGFVAVEPDVEPEPATEVEPEAGSEPEAWPEVEAEPELHHEPEAEPETAVEPEAEAVVEPETEAEPETETVVEAEPEPEAVVEPETYAEADVEPEAVVEPETDAEADVEPAAMSIDADTLDEVPSGGGHDLVDDAVSDTSGDDASGVAGVAVAAGGAAALSALGFGSRAFVRPSADERQVGRQSVGLEWAPAEPEPAVSAAQEAGPNDPPDFSSENLIDDDLDADDLADVAALTEEADEAEAFPTDDRVDEAEAFPTDDRVDEAVRAEAPTGEQPIVPVDTDPDQAPERALEAASATGVPPTEVMASEVTPSDAPPATKSGLQSDVANTPVFGEPGSSVARISLSTGEELEVFGPIVIGRAPNPDRVEAEDPTLVAVPSPSKEISSTHLDIRPGTGIDLGLAVATDLNSTNGSIVMHPGLGPRTLRPGVAEPLFPGTVIDLGDGLTIQVATPQE
jgi:hypothetical protein